MGVPDFKALKSFYQMYDTDHVLTQSYDDVLPKEKKKIRKGYINHIPSDEI